MSSEKKFVRWQGAAHLSVSETLATMNASEKGLSSQEAKRLLERYGPNVLETHEVRWWRTLLHQFQSSFVFLLLSAAGFSFLLGERLEAGIMILFVFINAAIGFTQEHRSAKAVEALKLYLISRSRVLRDGEEIFIDSADIVPGDILRIVSGDKLAADARFLSVNGLMMDEEVLTGESVAMAKTNVALSVPTAEMYEANSIGFAGTIAVHGSGTAIALSTGAQTAMGEVAHLSENVHRESEFEQGMRRFSRFILRLVIVTISLVFCANLLLKGEGADSAELLIFSLVLVISVIPEALPVVMTVALSRGSLRLARKNVVVKRLSAIEDLGSIEVLCADKTGTLTKNSLSVSSVYAEKKQECLRAAAIASDYKSLCAKRQADPFDIALWAAVSESEREEIARMRKTGEVPFDPERRRNSVTMLVDSEKELIVRGAPEHIFEICDGLDLEDIERYHAWMDEEGAAGRRVLALAKKTLSASAIASAFDEKHLKYLGMISFLDPMKETASGAVRDAKNLGVSVKILTGDSASVSAAVARRIGLLTSFETVMTGREFDALSEAEKEAAAHRHAVFARVSPQQKYTIIQTLQKTKSVGFLGEGINDAPALQLANVALAVRSSSDIAREAADVVLLDASLSVIIDGIREGRAIFANMIKYIKTTLSSNFGNFYSVAVISLLIPFVPMLPVQILLIDILSGLPTIALVTDTVEHGELERPTQYRAKDIVLAATLFGIVSSVFDFIVLATFYRQGESVLQTNWFILSLLTELVIIFSLRSRKAFFLAKRPSKTLVFSAMIMAISAIVFPFSSIGRDAFSFTSPSTSSFLLILFLTGAYFIVTEVMKVWYHRLSKADD